MVLDEIPDAFGDWLSREVASFLNLFSDLPRNIIGPVLTRVEGHHANRFIEIPAHEIGDHGCILGVCVYAAFELIPRHLVFDKHIANIERYMRRSKPLLAGGRPSARAFADG